MKYNFELFIILFGLLLNIASIRYMYDTLHHCTCRINVRKHLLIHNWFGLFVGFVGFYLFLLNKFI